MLSSEDAADKQRPFAPETFQPLPVRPDRRAPPRIAALGTCDLALNELVSALAAAVRTIPPTRDTPQSDQQRRYRGGQPDGQREQCCKRDGLRIWQRAKQHERNAAHNKAPTHRDKLRRQNPVAGSAPPHTTNPPRHDEQNERERCCGCVPPHELRVASPDRRGGCGPRWQFGANSTGRNRSSRSTHCIENRSAHRRIRSSGGDHIRRRVSLRLCMEPGAQGRRSRTRFDPRLENCSPSG